MKRKYYCQILGYVALLPFLLGTYLTWCGPMQEVLFATNAFTLYSVLIISFLTGSAWIRIGQTSLKTKLIFALTVSILAVAILLCWILYYLPAMLVLLGISYISIWLHSFYFPSNDRSMQYRTLNMLFTFTAFVCHLQVALQIHQF